MDVVLNELSISDGNSGRVNEWYTTLFDTCFFLGDTLKTNISLISTKRMSQIVLDDNMLFQKWLSTITNSEKKSAIISMVSKKPLLLDYPYYYYQDLEAKGLGYAYENRLLPISFNNNSKWHQLFLDIELKELDPETTDIIEEKLTVIHSWDSESSSNHLEFLKRQLSNEQVRIVEAIDSGNDLWERREALFSSLKFCESTNNQISRLSGMTLRNLCSRLMEMNNYFSNWEEGDFERSGFGGSPRLESNTRLDKFKNILTIKCIDGENRLFSLHCNYGSKDLRLHFYPDTEKRICHIGYIGKKIT